MWRLLSLRPLHVRASMCVFVLVCGALPSETACGLIIQQVDSWYLAVLVRPCPVVEGKKNSSS